MQPLNWGLIQHTQISEEIFLPIISKNRGKILYDIPYMWNLQRNDTNELTTQKQTHRYKDTTSGYQRKEGSGEGRDGVWD